MKPDRFHRITEASDLIGDALRKLLATDRGLHAETAVASAARMSGTLLLQSYAREIAGTASGAPILSAAADRDGRALVDTLFATLRQLGHADIGGQSLRGRRETAGLSRLSLAETRERLGPWFRKTGEVSGLSPGETAAAAAMATAALIHDASRVLDPCAGCCIAVDGIVESLHTAP